MKPPAPITFFYYDELAPAARFYGEVLGFALVEDQGWAKIYRVRDGAFVGIVDGARGSFRPQAHNAVLLTLVVDDVDGWHAHLTAHGVPFRSELEDRPAIGIRCFFVEDPGGYAVEIQQFTDPDTAARFA